MASNEYIKLKELEEGTQVRFSNDLKLAAALVTCGQDLVGVEKRVSPRNNKTEYWFGFEAGEALKSHELSFLSGKLEVDASTVMDNRDKLLSYITNQNQATLQTLGKIVK
jgi:hypothetical protein